MSLIKPIRIYYCKSLKKTGKPIIVQDLEEGTEYNINEVIMNNVDIKIRFNNSTGKAKASGATTILEVYRR